jgi:peptidoglycan/LPS O-acetylase OafA/YrhL
MSFLTNGNDARVPSLDGLRGFSILLVIVGHVAGTRGFLGGLAGLHQLGNWGVKIFFIISGLVITRLLLLEKEREGHIDLRRFWRRRIARIVPAYVVYVATMWAASSGGLILLEKGDIISALSFTMNYKEARSWYLNHCWSLSVEEQFYILWPLAVLFVSRRSLAFLCLAIILAAPILRLGMWYEWEATPSAMTRYLPAVADALAAGALLAALGNKSISWVSAVTSPAMTWMWLVLTFLLPAVLFKVHPGWFYVLGQSIAVMAGSLFIAGCVLKPECGLGCVVNNPILVWHGTISYSLYLWQEPFLNSFDPGLLTSFPQNIALAYGSALISFHIVEKPLRGLLQRPLHGLIKRTLPL